MFPEFPDYTCPGLSISPNPFTEFDWTPDKRRKIIKKCKEAVDKEKLQASLKQCNNRSNKIDDSFQCREAYVVDAYF